MAVELDYDFAWPMVIDDLKFANVSWIDKNMSSKLTDADARECLDCSPCRCMTPRNLTTTLDEGLMSTWRFPRRSALTMLFKQSFWIKLNAFQTGKNVGRLTRTDMRTIWNPFYFKDEGRRRRRGIFGLSVFGNQIKCGWVSTVQYQTSQLGIYRHSSNPPIAPVSSTTNQHGTLRKSDIMYGGMLIVLLFRVVFVLKPPREPHVG